MVNGVYFWWRSQPSDLSPIAEWVGYMPELEASQRNNPFNFLQSADSSDKRYVVWDNSGSTPVSLLARAALACKSKAWTLATYPPGAGQPTYDRPIQMPDRLYLGELNQRQQDCVRRNLPKGYALAHLMKPVVANRIGWRPHDLQLMPQTAARKTQAD